MPARFDDLLSQRLAGLPPADGGESGWQAVQHKLRRREANRERIAQAARWTMVASIAVLGVVVALSVAQQRPRGDAVPAVAAAAPGAAEIQALRAQSVALEQVLAALPERPAVARGGTALPIDTLEAQVQWLDHQLSGGVPDIAADEQAQLWRERVDAMNSLVRLRYAEAQQIAM